MNDVDLKVKQIFTFAGKTCAASIQEMIDC